MEHASEDCRRRVETRVRDVPDATLAPYRLAWRESIEAGRTIDLGVEDFVVPAD